MSHPEKLVAAAVSVFNRVGGLDRTVALIEAAPELLEACKAALPALSAHEQTRCDCPDSEAARLLRAAIAKAESN